MIQGMKKSAAYRDATHLKSNKFEIEADRLTGNEKPSCDTKTKSFR